MHLKRYITFDTRVAIRLAVWFLSNLRTSFTVDWVISVTCLGVCPHRFVSNTDAPASF
jgi:hypothetical protein